jgi:biopolymer transport protein ExbD
VVIGLEPGGRITCRGEVTNLNGVAAAVADNKTVVIRVAPETPSLHVALVLGVLEEQEVRTYHFAFAGSLLEATLRARYWDREIGDVIGGHAAGSTFVVIGRDGTYFLGDRETRDPGVLERWLRETRTGLEGTLGIPPLAHVDPEFGVPFGVAARVLVAFHRAGYPETEWRGVPLAANRREDFTLPPPPDPDSLNYFGYPGTCYCQPEFAPMNLPAAPMADADKSDDPDDRLIVQVDGDGHVYVKAAQVDLDRLSALLKERVRWYDLKLRAKGKRGMEDGARGGEFSKLYVLVRAAADASWEHVAWVLHVLAEQRIYKVQFAAQWRWADDHACRRWSLDGKLQAFLPTAPPAAHEHVLDISILADGKVRFRGRETENVSDLTQWIRDEDPPELTRAVVDVDRAVAHGRVVAVADRINAAAIEKIDFTGIGPPPAAVRALERLPR